MKSSFHNLSVLNYTYLPVKGDKHDGNQNSRKPLHNHVFLFSTVRPRLPKKRKYIGLYLERKKIQIGKGTDERLFVCGNSCQWPESLNFPLKVVIEDNLASGLDKLSHPDAQNLRGDSIYCQVFTCCGRSSHASAPEADTGLCHASSALGSICNVDIVNHL